jgi:hypothetical protein
MHLIWFVLQLLFTIFLARRVKNMSYQVYNYWLYRLYYNVYIMLGKKQQMQIIN